MADEMTVTRLASGLSTTVGAAAKVAAFLDDFPPSLSYRLANLWRIAHVGAHLAFRASTEILAELANLPVDGQAPLFEVPADHAMAVREIEAFVDALKERLVGAALAWESKATISEEPEVGLVETLLVAIYTSGGASLEICMTYGEEASVGAALATLLQSEAIALVDDRYVPIGGSLDVDRSVLAELYEEEVGRAAGKKSDAQLRAEITDARMLVAKALIKGAEG